MNAHQMNVYQLAENLGMTVTRMLREMTMSEYFGWMAFYGERERQERGGAKKKSPPRPSRDGEVILRGFNL